MADLQVATKRHGHSEQRESFERCALQLHREGRATYYAVVDEERRNVLPWVLFHIPTGLGGARTLHFAELFKVSGGKYTNIQAIMVNQTLGTPSGGD